MKSRKVKRGARPGRFTEENWEDLLDRHGKTPRSDFAVSATPIEDQAEAVDESTYRSAAVVMYVASGRCRVFHDGAELDCFTPPEIAVRQKSSLAVGDRALIYRDGDLWKVASVLPRRSVLARPDPLQKHVQRLIAANIDLVVHVVSVKAPPLRPRLIDRYLIAISRGGARPVICVNKVDLLDESSRAAELSKLDVYRDLGVPVIACSSRSGEGLDDLRGLVQGNTAALVGHSGVGKSSILNALDARLQIATRDLKRRQGTGRHTTSASTLYDFGEGTYLIDTPGIREFGLWDLDRESLKDYFPEFDEPSESCRFTNCSHVHEPDCEVKERVESGGLNRARYETYVRLYEDLAK